jgi:prefoldin subunit 5
MQQSDAAAAEMAKAEFIADVEKYMDGRQPEEAILELQERLRRYKLLEQQLLAKRERLAAKLPEIQKALDVVAKLVERRDAGAAEPLGADFELSEGVYAHARVAPDVAAVNLWLGAGVMVEYPLDEARELLATNLSNCAANLETVRRDLEAVKGGATTTEVSVARVFNWDVERRRALKQQAVV